MSARRGATALCGVLALDKPSGMTSHDVVNVVRRVTGERRVGHAGTLDPSATGLLLVLVGPATRLGPYLSTHTKSYEARIVFGTSTDTDDADGTVTDSADVPQTAFDPEFAQTLLDRLSGESMQIPPAFSAIKLGGTTAHRAARAGRELDLAPRPIVVSEALLLALDAERGTYDARFTVSKGTYIRAIARDLGRLAGTHAHLGALRRTRIGVFDVHEAHGLESVQAAALAGRIEPLFADPVALLGLPLLAVEPEVIADGRSLPSEMAPWLPDGALVAVVTHDRLAAVYRAQGASLRPDAVIPGGVSGIHLPEGIQA